MKKYLYFRSREEKIELIANLFPEIFKEESILDVGCADKY
jgi:hypothetical protein